MSDLNTHRRKLVFAALALAFARSVFPGGEAGFGFSLFNRPAPKQHETELGATLQESPPQVRRTSAPPQRKGAKALKLIKEQLVSEKASSSKLRAEVSSMQAKQAQTSKHLQQSSKVEKELRAQVAAAEKRAEQATAMAMQLKQSAVEVQTKAFQLELRSLTSEDQQSSEALQELSSLRTRLDEALALVAEAREQRETASAQAQRLEADLATSQGEARTLAQHLKDLAIALGVGGLGGFFMRWMTHREVASEAQQKIRQMQREVQLVTASKRR